MKRILILGVRSYVGTSFQAYLDEFFPGQYEIARTSLRGDDWKDEDWSGYDCVLNVTGKAHADISGLDDGEKQEYYHVNCDLAYEAACKAKEQGVKQYIYMSSVIVYGESTGIRSGKHISKDTPPFPTNFYGDSKWQAEMCLKELGTTDFHVALVRCPMVYGRDSKGNFVVLRKVAEKFFVFPRVNNKRSMIYVENLAEFIRMLAESNLGGVFFPQNAEYVNPSRMVKLIRNVAGKSMYLSVAWGIMVYFASHVPGNARRFINKAFGSFTIDPALSNQQISGYQIYSLEESIRRIHEG